MTVITLRAFEDNFIHVLIEGDRAAVVDPGEAEVVEACLRTQRLQLDRILITHYHGDHTGGAPALALRHRCPVFGPDGKAPAFVTHPVTEGPLPDFADVKVIALSVPGHTRNHLAFHLPEPGCVFTGDTLFHAGCGRLLEGTAGEMWQSLLRLRALPPLTRIYCGHDYTADNLAFATSLEPSSRASAKRLATTRLCPPTVSTMEEECETNIFLRADEPAVAKALGMSGATAVEVFTELRRRKNAW